MFRGAARLTPIAIDIDQRNIAAVQLSGAPGSWRIHAATMLRRSDAAAESSPSDESRIPTSSELQRLSEVLSRQGFKGSQVVIALPESMLLHGVLDAPPASSGAPIEQIARMELARIHRCAPVDFEMAAWPLPIRQRFATAQAVDRHSAEFMAMACRTAQSLPLIEAFESAGWDVAALGVSSWATAHACQPLINAMANGGPAALLQIRWDAAAMILVHQDVVAYERVLPEAAWSRLRSGLIAKSSIAPEIVDYLLSHVGIENATGTVSNHGAAASAVPMITSQLDTLAQEVRASCSYLHHRHADISLQQLVLSGEGANLPGIGNYLSRKLSMDVKIATPAAMGMAGEDVLTPGDVNSGAFTAAIGMAMLHGHRAITTAHAGRPFNLIPADRRESRQRGKRRRAWMTLATTYATFIALTILCTRVFARFDHRTVAAQMTSVTNELESLEELNQSLRKELKQVHAAWQTHHVMSDQPDWSLLLALIAQTVSDQVVLRTFELNPIDAAASSEPAVEYNLILTGFGRTQLEVSQFVLKLEQLELFTQVKLVETRREPYLNAESIAFRVVCTLQQK